MNGVALGPVRSLTYKARDGLEIPIENTVAPINNRQGQPTGAVIVFRDVSVARERLEFTPAVKGPPQPLYDERGRPYPSAMTLIVKPEARADSTLMRSRIRLFSVAN